ncbi:serine/threonine protein kinase-like protein 2 [Dermatophagoides farinae]|uniref:Serine/threonine protein kinase-like protein 2 n=1 Tax=Dermatophagoides farinae TaxID=6954 RepID=A0A9D4P481_DERFA|nr:serine/threonine protein kinase-like protein 2 [Dermatophagoides farinae]
MATGNRQQQPALSQIAAISNDNDNDNNNNMTLINEKTKIYCERITRVYDRLKNGFKQINISSEQSTSNNVDNNKGVQYINQNNNNNHNENGIKLLDDENSGSDRTSPPVVKNLWHEKIDKHDKQLEYLTNQMYRKCLHKNGYETNDSNWFLAKGGFGLVFRIERNGIHYACKVISNVMQKLNAQSQQQQHKNNNILNTIKMKSRFYSEVNIMRRASRHENIVTLIDYFENDCPFDDHDHQVIINHCDSTDKSAGDEAAAAVAIGQQQQQQQNPPLYKCCFIIMEYANSQTLMFADMVSAVRFLHQQRIVHRDIKLSNMLLHRPSFSTNNNHHRKIDQRFNYIVKLCDFGLSTLLDHRNDESSTDINNSNDEREIFFKPVGTSIYMAPEILRSYYFYSKKNIDMISPYCAYKGDVWALGVCLFYTLHGFYPLDVVRFNTKQERLQALKRIFEPSNEWQQQYRNDVLYTQIYGRNIEKRLRNYNYRLSSDCRDCLSWMLAIQPTKRATIEQIGEHPFMANNNNNKQ